MGGGAGGGDRYAYVRYPWRARIDTRSSRPARHYATLIGQTLRYGMPARRRFGWAWALMGRRGIPEGLLARASTLAPKVADGRIDMVLRGLAERWSELARRSARLPAAAPALSALALERSVGLTVFAFGEVEEPLVVAKLPTFGSAGATAEVQALCRAEAAGVAPRYLGTAAGAHAQEAVDGAPLRVEPLTPDRAAALGWAPEHHDLASALVRLADATAQPTRPPTLEDRMERALAYDGLGARAHATLAAAWKDVRRIEASVLRHCDASPQNCLYSGRRLAGIVDWELAEPEGVPGFDVWNSMLSYVEHGLGLVEWSEELAVEALARSWDSSPFWRNARLAARDAARAGGAPDDRLDALELVFFGSRIGDRLALPGIRRGTGVATSARMCELVATG